MTQFRVGKRLIKTAVAVYVTAEICYLLDWPMIFAVIAAIVSIEPTVHASIRKGVIRLPSAAIGAVFAMLFDAWLGIQPITFALSALATIYVCHKIGWTDSIVVATLTSVNMIYVTEANFIAQFAIRLGTTATGIIVAALVNYLLFRPSYAAELKVLLQDVTPRMLAKVRELMQSTNPATKSKVSTSTIQSIDQLQTLLGFQISDYRYNRTTWTQLREMASTKRTLQLIRRMQFYCDAIATSRDQAEQQRCLASLSALAGKLEDTSDVRTPSVIYESNRR